MTLNGAIRQLAEMRDSEYMPIMFKPLFDKVIETVSECEEPAADVAPVRRGRWKWQDDPARTFHGWPMCSECGAISAIMTPYCCVCGAKMDGGDSK